MNNYFIDITDEQIKDLAEYLEVKIDDWDSTSFTDETDGTNMLEMWITDYFMES